MWQGSRTPAEFRRFPPGTPVSSYTKFGMIIGKDKNRRFKSYLKEGTAVTGGLGLCIPITLHCKLQLSNLKTTAHGDTKFQAVNLDA